MLFIEELETRRLLAPIAPFGTDLLSAGDTGSSSTDNITSLNNGTLQLTAQTNSTVNIYNGATLLGAATGQNDTVFYETGGTVVIDAEMGLIQMPMCVTTTYIYSYGTTAAVPTGSATYQFYINTPGVYYVRGYDYWTSVNYNSMFVNIDRSWQPGDTGPALWSTTYSSWHNVTATTTVDNAAVQSWNLTAGWHTLQFYGREPNAYVNRFAISTNIAANPQAAASTTYETYKYTLAAGNLNGSAAGTNNSITATATLSGTSPASTPLVICYDTGTTTPAAPDLSGGTDTGSSDSDNITSNANGVFTGTAEAGATVWLRVGGSNRRSATADGSGNYSITAQTGDLTVGNNLVDVYYVDLAGNTSADSPDLTVTLDASIQTPAAPDLEAGSDSGRSTLDNLTNATDATLTAPAGAVEANCTVTLRINGEDCRSTTAQADGSYSVTLSPGDLAQGDNILDIYCTDAAGNTSTDSADLTVTLDTTVPTATAPDLQSGSDTGVSNSDNLTACQTPTVDGAAEPLALVDLYLNGQLKTQITASASGDWSYTFADGALTIGNNDIYILTTDLAGNISAASDILQITLTEHVVIPPAPDLLAGSDSGRSNLDNLTNATAATLSGPAGAVEGSCTVWLRVNGINCRSTTANANGSYSVTLSPGDLAQGDNILDIYCTDAAGNTSTDSADLTVTLDTTAPTATAPDLQPGSDTGVSNNDNLTACQTPTVDGAAEPLALVDLYLNGQLKTQITASAGGYWSYTFADGALTTGQNDIYVRITDIAGNTSAASSILQVTLEDQTPTPTTPTPQPGAAVEGPEGQWYINNAQPEITGTASPESAVQIVVNGAVIKTVQADGAGEWNYRFDEGELAEGSNQIETICTDPAGNANRSTPLRMTVDTIAPVLESYSPSGACSQSTDTLNLFLDTQGMDLTALADMQGFTLWASGGDGTFGDGNEYEVPLSGVEFIAAARCVQLKLNETLPDETYQLAVDPAASLHDAAGNAARLSAEASHKTGLYQDGVIVLDFAIDTTAPAVPEAPTLAGDSDSGDYNNDGVTNICPPRVLINAEPGVSISVLCNGYSAGLAAEITPGCYELTIPAERIREGANLLAAQAADALGNQSDLSPLGTIVYDAAAPQTSAILVDNLYYNNGPGEIRIAFEEANLNTNRLTSAADYRLIGSGGDGVFDNGNETEVTFSQIAYDTAGGNVVLTLPQTATGVSQLGPDQYRLMVVAGGELADLAGNGLAKTTTQDFRVAQATVLQRNQHYAFCDSQGHGITVKLIGPGQAQIVLGTATDSPNTIETILLTGTTETTRLEIISHHADGLVTVGNILSDGPMYAVKGENVQIAQSLMAEGIVRHVSFGAIAAGAVIDAASDDLGIRLDVGPVGADATIRVQGRLTSLNMAGCADSDIIADSAGAIVVGSGDVNGDITITQGNLDCLAIRQGDFSGRLDVAARLGRLKANRGNVSADISADSIGVISTRQLADNIIRAAGDIDQVRVRRAENAAISAAGDLKNFYAAHNVTGSTLSAGRNCGRIVVRGDCLDNLFLAGANLGDDGKLDGSQDIFHDGNIDLLAVRGSYLGTTVAAAINPGADLAYFTADDHAASSGRIGRVRFAQSDPASTKADHDYGLICTEPIPTIRIQGLPVTSPFDLNQFHLRTIDSADNRLP